MRKSEVTNILELCNEHELIRPEVIRLSLDWFALKWGFPGGSCHMYIIQHESALHFMRAIYSEKKAGHSFYWQPKGDLPPVPPLSDLAGSN